MVIEIPLSKGYVTLIDDEDIDLASTRKWHALVRRQTGVYAAATVGDTTLYLHRLLVDAPKGFHVDHKNRDTLDNRRENLRVATSAENNANSPARNGRKFKGIQFKERNNIWCARIWEKGIHRHIGCSRSEEEAARMYDKAALELYGDFTHLNLPDLEVAS